MSSGPPFLGTQDKIKPPKGIYKARVIDLDTIKDVRCGEHLADIYKVHYRVQSGEFKDFVVKDNGVFRYKEKDGFLYDPIGGMESFTIYYSYLKILMANLLYLHWTRIQ